MLKLMKKCGYSSKASRKQNKEWPKFGIFIKFVCIIGIDENIRWLDIVLEPKQKCVQTYCKQNLKHPEGKK